MKLVMTLLVRDEADIIARNLDFHLGQGVDHVVVVDNGSIDGTRDILADYAARGQVTMLSELGRDYNQTAWVTWAAMVAIESHGADWILHSDADEFWKSPTGNLKAELAGTGADVLQCRRWHMIYGWDAGDRTPWTTRCRYRAAFPTPVQQIADIYTDPLDLPYFYMDLPSKVLTRASGLVRIAQGNHAATFDGGATITAPSNITIYHYPIRSVDRFRRKVAAGAAAYARNTALSPLTGWHWRRWGRMLDQKGTGAVLDDALPDRARLLADLARDVVIEDRTMLTWFEAHPPPGPGAR